jgi:hypothetical protein
MTDITSGITSDTVYVASNIKSKRFRATKDDVRDREDQFHELIENMRPMTVRRVFYQAASVRKLVDKSESGYTKVQTDLCKMRRAGKLPYDWLADNTRWQRKPSTFDGPDHMLKSAAKTYRKDLWCRARVRRDMARKGCVGWRSDADHRIYDVPLMVARGYASLSFLYSAAEYIKGEGSGLYLPSWRLRPVRRQCRREDRADITRNGSQRRDSFRTLGRYRSKLKIGGCLRGQPRKATRGQVGHESVELDAISPNQLRDLVKSAIERHLPAHELKVLQEAEEANASSLADSSVCSNRPANFETAPRHKWKRQLLTGFNTPRLHSFQTNLNSPAPLILIRGTDISQNMQTQPLDLLFERARMLADRAKDGSLPFLDAVDMAYSAADLSGLVEKYGDDVVQVVLADAFESAMTYAMSDDEFKTRVKEHNRTSPPPRPTANLVASIGSMNASR